ncbi:MAG TPA: ATP-binding protein [Candidatus Hydrogenedentes bacterium]|nr:ATP-binding protein [Candidatus Hydrogenedentota bacterium]
MTSAPREPGAAGLRSQYLFLSPFTPHRWLTTAAGIRILVILLAMTNSLTAILPRHAFLQGVILGTGLICLGWAVYLLVLLRRGSRLPLLAVWAQVFLDLALVCLVVGFTGNIKGPSTYLLLLVVFEAGLFLGLAQAVFFAILAALFLWAASYPWPAGELERLFHVYDLTLIFLCLIAIAFISGFWNYWLNRMAQFQRDILDRMNNGFLVTDARGRVLGMNLAAERILGLSVEQGVGRPIDQIMVPEAGMECPVITALKKQIDYISHEFTAVTPNGPRVIGLTTNRIFPERTSEDPIIIVSFSDLTEVARMREEVQRHSHLAVLGELSAELAHEIRNPVTAIRGAAEELARVTGTTDLIQRLTRMIQRESEHLNNVVSGFLQFSRSGQVSAWDPVDVAALAKEVAEAGRYRFPNGAITVQLSEHADCRVAGDSQRLKQLMMNLLNNALEAMDGKGEAIIRVNRSGNVVEIRVEDHGPGFPPDKINKFFEPFYSEKPRGTGMGLSVCQRVVEALNGSIQLGNRPNGGGVVIVRFPAYEAADGLISSF